MPFSTGLKSTVAGLSIACELFNLPYQPLLYVLEPPTGNDHKIPVIFVIKYCMHDTAMGQNPVPPVNIPMPTKIGSKMGGAPKPPKWDPIGVEPRPYVNGPMSCNHHESNNSYGFSAPPGVAQQIRGIGSPLVWLTSAHICPHLA